MKYEQKSFTVPASSVKAPADCRHGWIAKGRCILCGQVTGVGPTDTTSSRVSVPGGSARLSIPPQGAGVGAAKGSADASNPTVQYTPTMGGMGSLANAMGLAMYGADGSHPASAALISGTDYSDFSKPEDWG